MSSRPILVVLVLAACREADEADWVSNAEVEARYGDSEAFEIEFAGGGYQTNGLVMPEGSEYAVAGMGEMTCQVDLLSNTTYFDLDAGPGEDMVVDSLVELDTVSVLTQFDGGFSLIDVFDPDNGTTYAPPNIEIGGVAVGGGATVAVRARRDDGSCSVQFLNKLGTDLRMASQVDVASSFCRQAGAIEIDDAGVAWLAGIAGTARVTSGGNVEVVPVTGDLIVLGDDMVYVAQQGGSTVTAITDDGTVAWEESLDMEVHDLAPAPDGVLVSIGQRTSALVALDAENGGELGRIEIDMPVGEVTSDGDQIVISRSSGGWEILTRTR